MSPSTSHPGSSRRDLLLLWAAILAGPLLFLADLQTSYMLAGPACEAGARGILLPSTAVAAGLVVAAGMLAVRRLRTLPQDADPEGARVPDRNRFLAMAGVVLSAGFLLLIVANLVPKLILGLCD